MSTRAAVVRPLVRFLASVLPRFAASRSGNVAVIFAIALIPVIAAMGVAVDYTRAAQTSTEMQDALDAASLALSRRSDLSTMTQAQIQKFAEDYFAANFQNSELQGLTLNASYTVTGPSVTISASGSLPTDFMGIIGTKNVPIGSSSTTIWGEAKLRVALALDNTGSMQDYGKMTALKTATHNLLTQLRGAASVNGDVYVSIIPFVRDVNAGSSNYNTTWVDWTDWGAEPSFSKPGNWAQIGPGSACPFPTNWSGTPTYGFTCTDRPATASGAQTASSVPNSGTYKGYICPSIDSGNISALKNGIYYNGCYTSTTYSCTGSSCSCNGYDNCSCSGRNSSKTCKTISGYYEHPWVPNAHSTWNGCVMDRDQNYDQLNTAPSTTDASTLFPAQQYSACPTQLVGLSYDWTALNSKVDAMSPNGSTNQGISLQWAWQSLTASPFTIPAMDPSKVYKQIIILLTDGLNTQNRWDGTGFPNQSASTIAKIDNRMYKSGSPVTGTCKNIKDAGIIIYTVQVNTGGDPTSTLLQNCASDSDKFFLLTNANQIVTTFQQIGTELSELRISK